MLSPKKVKERVSDSGSRDDDDDGAALTSSKNDQKTNPVSAKIKPEASIESTKSIKRDEPLHE